MRTGGFQAMVSPPSSAFLIAFVTLEPPEEKREKGWYHSYIKPQGGLDYDLCGLGLSIPTHQIAID